MSEKSTKTKKQLANNADKIAIGVLVLILLGLGYAWWQEQNNTLGSEAATGKPATLNDQLADSPALEMLQEMSGQPTMESDPSAQRIAQLNMYDFSTLQQESALEAQAQEQVKQAKTLIESGQTEQARPLLENAVNVIAYNAEALQLLDSITTKTDGTAPAADNMGMEQQPF